MATGGAPSTDASGGGERCGARLKPTSDGMRRGAHAPIRPIVVCAPGSATMAAVSSALRGTDGGAPGTTGDDSSPSESRRVVGVVPSLGGDEPGSDRGEEHGLASVDRDSRRRSSPGEARASTSRSRFMRAAGYRGRERSAQTTAPTAPRVHGTRSPLSSHLPSAVSPGCSRRTVQCTPRRRKLLQEFCAVGLAAGAMENLLAQLRSSDEAESLAGAQALATRLSHAAGPEEKLLVAALKATSIVRVQPQSPADARGHRGDPAAAVRVM